MPVLTLSLHARLAPVAGTNATGRFSGLLVKPGQPMAAEPSPTPRFGNKWRLSWKVSLPALRGRVEASLRIPARNGAPGFVHVLCTGCTTAAHGTITLPNSQALRVAGSRASIVVRSSSAMLRGAVRARTNLPRS
jgi:hypothetical protein